MKNKQVLLELIKKGNVENISLVGKPKQNLSDVYFNGDDLISFFDDNELEYYSENEERIKIHFPTGIVNGRRTELDNVCLISINKIAKDDVENLENLFEEVYEYYQVEIPPTVVDKIYKMTKEKLTTADMFALMNNMTQIQLANIAGRARQTISDLKTGKTKMTLDILGKLMNEFPLLPWFEYIKDQAE